MNNTHNSQLRFVSSEDLRCPNCNSTDLKKVSLAYQEGLFCTVAHTRFSAAAVGGHGPGLIIGKATNRGFHQSVLSKQLKPPVKWSYRKLILSWALVFLSIGWIVFYINTKNSSSVLSPRLILLSGLAAAALLVLVPSSAGTISPPTSVSIPSGNARSCQDCGTLVERSRIGRAEKS